MRSKRLIAVILAVTGFWGAGFAYADLAGTWALRDAGGVIIGTAQVSTIGAGTVTSVLVEQAGLPSTYFSLEPSGYLAAPGTGPCTLAQFVLTFQATGGSDVQANYWVECYALGGPVDSGIHGTAAKNCPNGVVDPEEDCDDGNFTAGDCCSACALELGCTCVEGVTQLADNDTDGVPTLYDDCPGTMSHLGVDNHGCALEQFCAAVDATTVVGRKDCPKMDWNNDEPRLKRNSRDCKVDHVGQGTADDLCIPAVTAPCLDGFSDCDDDESNGCEIRSEIDPLNCGDCGIACPSASNAQPSCLDSACILLCDAEFGDCDADTANGCETDLTSHTSCGTCGTVCGGSDPCFSGTCGCGTSRSDCDGNPATVCETTIIDNADHCGSCGNSCSGASCLGIYCRNQVKLVFLTSASFTGNLGGLSGADGLCAGLASAAGLTGTYRAWLSEFGQANTAGSRLTHSTVPYLRLDGVKVADDWTDLVDGSLAAPINFDELGNLVAGSATLSWTGTRSDGSNGGASACAQWTDGTSSAHGALGRPAIDGTWTYTSTRPCARSSHLYCVEQ